MPHLPAQAYPLSANSIVLSVEPAFVLEKAEKPFLELGINGLRFPEPSDDPVEGSWPFKAWTSLGSAGAQAAMMTI